MAVVETKTTMMKRAIAFDVDQRFTERMRSVS